MISLLTPTIYEIGTNPHGTRVLQQLINYLSTDELKIIYLQSITNYIIPFLKNLHGTHTVQKFATDHPQYFLIIDNIIIENSVELASDRHGCCVIQHYFKQYKNELFQKLVDKLVSNTKRLIVNQFGNYVIQTILLMNDIKYKNKIALQIAENIN